MKTKLYHSLILIVCAIGCWLIPVKTLAYHVFVDGFYYNFLDNETAEVTNNKHVHSGDYSGDVVIPESFVYDGIIYSVTSIGENAFYECRMLTSVTIPNSVTSISLSAFSGCTGLTSVEIPNSVTSIGSGAFSDCTGLTSVTIPNSVTNIYGSAFSGCTGLTSVTIPNSVTSIDQYAFSHCTGLTSISIPISVTSIGCGAFSHCTGLTSVTIPNSVTSIDGYAFGYCTGLTSILVDAGNSIYDSRNSCNAIIETATNKLVVGCKNTIIPNSVTIIGGSAFEGCTGLTSVTIPNSVTNIYGFAFSGCTGLTSVTIPNSVTIIGGSAFEGCTGLTSVTIPNSVTSIVNDVFHGCTGLTSVTIPNSVTSIGEYAFSGCTGLTSVTIPNSVTWIGERAFFCPNLLSIYVKGETPASICTVDEYGNDLPTFLDVDKSACVLYVPKGCKSAYENAEGWKYFQNIEELYPRVMVVEEATGGWSGWDVRGLVGMAYMRENYLDTFIGVGVHNGDSYEVSAYDNWMSHDMGIEGYPSAVINRTKIIDPNSAELEQNLNDMDPSSIFNMKLVATTNNDGMVRFLVELSSLASYTDVLYDMAFVILEDKLPINQSNLYSGGSYGPMGGFEDLPRNCNIEIDDVARAIYPSAKGSSEFVPSQIIRDEVYNIEYEAPLPNIVNVNNVWAAVLLIDHNTGEIVQATKTNTILFQEEPSTDISTLDNAIYVEQIDGRIGGTMDIPVKLKNSYPVRGFQFNLELPEGTTINGWELSTSRMPEGATLSDMIATKKIDGNKIQVACSLNYGNATFTGNDGEIATVNVTFSEGMEEGTYPIYLTACDLTTAGGIDEDLSDVTSTLVLEDYIVGDANGDGKIRIGDATTILNYIVGTASDNFNEKAADANGDGKIRIGDATTILNIIVNQ